MTRGKLVGDRPRFVVIPTNQRPCLKDCLMAIQPQVDAIVLVNTAPYTDGELRPPLSRGVAIRDLRKPPNISRWWNQGLNIIETLMPMQNYGTYDVAVLNDDVIVPPTWFVTVSEVMRTMGAAAGCSGGNFTGHLLQTHVGAIPLDQRMQGFAFILAGEKNIKANEDLRWYFSDDYVDWMARQSGGMVMVGGLHVRHLYPNAQMTPELQQICAEDAGKFLSLWGRMPW